MKALGLVNEEPPDQSAPTSCASGGRIYIMGWIHLAADPVSLFAWAAKKLGGEQAAQTAGPPHAPVYELSLPGKFFLILS